ncbi:PREDICTED: uncharacterized protein LOC105562314 [Vollenhovia emeryi]|uniref:uncharacterized protein LOC105562314 n=1 Tax=Vollenhovia emeryi TaxID=411798 RepID=UPI0005F3D642|nr:PREDICTED: uncharacterized protein LOC105562314 [Vollenhovia emeryi]
MHLHLELCRIARELNFIFGTQMTFELTTYLLFLTATCYYMYGMIMRKDRAEISITAWYHISSWAIVFVAKLFTINCICENVSVKANKIDKVVHRLINAAQYSDIRKEIYQFTLQKMHNPLKFTGMGLFYFGNQFLRKCCMTITTFMIIMIQMYNV